MTSRPVVYNARRGEKFQMTSPIPFQILLAVPCASLRDTITQILSNNCVRLAYAHNAENLFRSVSSQPDLILAEPFAFDEPGLDLLKRLKQQAPTIPLVVLLPFDTRDYRDAVNRMGANSIVITEELATSLWSTIERLLTRKDLDHGVTNTIAPMAQLRAPGGESAFTDHSDPSSLPTSSERPLEHPTPMSAPDKPTDIETPPIEKGTQPAEHYVQ